MAHKRKNSTILRSQAGFSMTEILFVIVAASLMVGVLYVFFANSINQYVRIQADGLAFSEISGNTQRIARVLRGATDVTNAQTDEITMFAYFSPNEQFVSEIKYYLNAGQTQLLADITPMTANPPLGTPIPAQKRTVTIVNNFYKQPGVNTFDYLDSVGGTLVQPIADTYTIKGVRINLAVKASEIRPQISNLSLSVSLRNRKTNL